MGLSGAPVASPSSSTGGRAAAPVARTNAAAAASSAVPSLLHVLTFIAFRAPRGSATFSRASIGCAAERKLDRVVEGERATVGVNGAGLAAEGGPRGAEVALEQPVPEGDGHGRTHRLPQRLHRGGEQDAEPGVALARRRHCHALDL